MDGGACLFMWSMEQTIQLHYLQKVRMNGALAVDPLTLSWS